MIRTSFDHAKEDALKAALAALGFVPAQATPKIQPAPSAAPPANFFRRDKHRPLAQGGAPGAPRVPRGRAGTSSSAQWL